MATRTTGFLSFIRRWWVLVALATVAGGFLGYLHGTRVESAYEAEAIVYVTQPGAGSAALRTASEHVPTYAELVGSGSFLEQAAERLGRRLTDGEPGTDVRGEGNRDTRLVTIRVRSPEAEGTVAIANAVAEELVSVVNRAGRAAPPGELLPRVRIVERADGVRRVRPRSTLSAGFGALAGLFAALAVATLGELFRRTVRSEDELAEISPASFLGSVDGGPLSPAGRTPSDPSRTRIEVDSYGILVRRLEQANEGRRPRAVLVAGVSGSERSGLVAGNLAAALAVTGRVTLADLGGKGELVRLFTTARTGDGRPLVGPSAAARRSRAVVTRFPVDLELPLTLASLRDPLPARLDLDRGRDLLELLLAEADTVVLHGAPPDRSPATLGWARLADATVLVARLERTRRRSVASSLQTLRAVGAKTVGTVLYTARNA
jgi:succinoglycan biosynthesis transport protein ExoP